MATIGLLHVIIVAAIFIGGILLGLANGWWGGRKVQRHLAHLTEALQALGAASGRSELAARNAETTAYGAAEATRVLEARARNAEAAANNAERAANVAAEASKTLGRRMDTLSKAIVQRAQADLWKELGAESASVSDVAFIDAETAARVDALGIDRPRDEVIKALVDVAFRAIGEKGKDVLLAEHEAEEPSSGGPAAPVPAELPADGDEWERKTVEMRRDASDTKATQPATPAAKTTEPRKGLAAIIGPVRPAPPATPPASGPEERPSDADALTMVMERPELEGENVPIPLVPSPPPNGQKRRG